MVPVLVEVEVKPERLDEFLEVMRQDACGSRTEPGCLRFDVMQDQTNPCKFVFYEVYKDAEAAAAHREYAHFKLWTDFKVRTSQIVSIGERRTQSADAIRLSRLRQPVAEDPPIITPRCPPYR